MAVEGVGGGGQVPAEVRALLAEVSLAGARALAATLTPGEILQARVGADLGDGKVALTLRGQTLVADAQAALRPDALVKLLVHSTGDQTVLRLLAPPASDVVATSTPAARAQALGLPATPAATTALQAFEQAGAPLDPVRLKEAAAQLQALPAAQVPQRAAALAALAQAGLPATPPFISLAERVGTGVLPNPAEAVAGLRVALREAGVVVVPGPVAGGQSPVAGGRPPEAVNLPAEGRPPVIDARPPVIDARPPIGDGRPAAQPPATGSQPPATPAPTQPLPAASAPPAAPPPAATSAQPPAPSAQRPAPGAPPAPPAPGTPAPAPAAPPVGAGTPAVTLPAALASIASPPAVPVPVPGLTLAGLPLPDLGRGGAAAVLQALALAGVRPRETGELLAPRAEPTLLHQLALPVEEAAPARALDDATHQRLPPQLEAAVAHVMREQAAETVVKPQALVDYDLVLGLPLLINGQPLPARLAVAERQTTGGTATFLRVDSELSQLGPLSVRISGIEHGPMAITVLATGPALAELAPAMADLNESLRALGLSAGLRLADLAEDLDRG